MEYRFLNLISLIINALLMLYAIAIIIVGIHIILDHGLMLEITYGSIYLTGTYILIFSGMLLCFTTILGVIGGFKLDRFLLLAFIIMLIIILIITFIGSVLLLAFQGTINNDTKANMNKTLYDQYGRTKLYTDAWNMTQSRLRCCGVENSGWEIFQGSYWDKITNRDLNNRDSKINPTNPFYKYVPVSCCWILVDPHTGWPGDKFRNVNQCQNFHFGPPNLKSGPFNDAIYYRGCANALKSFIGTYSIGVGVFSFMFLFVIIAAIILAVLLLGKTSERDKESREKFRMHEMKPSELYSGSAMPNEDIPPENYPVEKLQLNPDGYREKNEEEEEEEDEVSYHPRNDATRYTKSGRT